MAELRFFHGTKEQYNKVASKSNKDFYVTHEVREIDGVSKEWLSLWLGDQLIGGAESYAMLVNEVKAREAADAQMADNLAKAVEELEAKIGQTSADKTYSIVAIKEGLGANIAEAFKLVDGNGVQAGETINIYKDSALKSVALDGQELVFTYVLADGSESVVRIDVSSFLHESEYGKGLEVIDHVVSVKRDDESDDFLTVSEKGVKVSGIRAALDAARQAHMDELAAEAKAREDADKALAADLAAEIVRADAAEKANAAAIAAEEARALAAEALLRANAVINVKAVDNSAVHVSVDASEKGKVVNVGMAWMNIAYEAASEGDLKSAFAAAEPEVRLASDVEIAEALMPMSDAVLDLNDKAIVAPKDIYVAGVASAAVSVKNGANVTVKGGKIESTNGIYAQAVEVRGGNLTIEDGEYVGFTTAVYAMEGTITINGGEFKTTDPAEGWKFLLNVNDAKYKNGTANIVVKGGRFHGFNPANNVAEGANTNFVAPGYVSVEVEPNVWEVMLKA